MNLTVYLQSMNDLPAFHRVHQQFFPGEAPALTVVEFDEVGSRGTRIEIEATAVIPGRGVQRRIVPGHDGRRSLHAAPAVEAGPLVFLSGVLGWEERGLVTEAAALPPAGRDVVERLGRERPRAAAQAWAALAHMATTLERAGLSLNDVVKLTVYLKDLADFDVFDAMRRAAGMAHRPAVSLVQVPRPGPTADCLLCLEAVAWHG